MILYVTLGTNDLARSIRFYDPVMAALGISRAPDWTEGWAGWGGSYDTGTSIWICAPFNKAKQSPGNGNMVAFTAGNEKQVQAFHAAALIHGGTDDGPPGTRPYYEPWFYVAYVKDPDGNKLAAVFHKHGL